MRGRFGDVFTDAMMDVIRAYNEERSDAAANTECHVVGHPCRIHDKAQGGEAAFVAKASYVGNADYEGYRQMARVRTDALRKAEDQLSRIIDRRTQTRRYRNVEDLFAQARSVSRERLAQIAQGYNDTCAVHEAVAFITATPQIKDSTGRDVSFNRWLVGHYLFGDRRRDNTPKVESLRELPRAVLAIRTRTPFKKISRSGAEQYQYSFAKPKTNAYAYCDSGVVSGWHVIYFGR